MRRLLIALPVVLIISLLALFAAMIGRGAKTPAPSRLVGTSAPAFTLDILNHEDGKTTASLADFKGQPVMVNFFASWCTPCRAEHPFLMQLAKQGVTIIGIDYKDKPHAATQMLDDLGNPFALVVRDQNGRTGIDYGITGVPESFMLDANGIIRASWSSPLDEEIIKTVIRPALDSAR